jgi:hypothetical protein
VKFIMHGRGRKKTSEGLHGCAVGAILHPNAIKRANKRLRMLQHYVKGVKSFRRSAPCSSAQASCKRVVEKNIAIELSSFKLQLQSSRRVISIENDY